MEKKYKIYTKGGDKGQTSLLDGTRVPKYHIRIQAYGTADELKSYLPLISCHQNDEGIKLVIENIQEKIFRLEALLATADDKSAKSLPPISENDILFLENEIDRMNEALPELKNFIMPGGSLASIHAHVARCICRRAERIIIELAESENVNPLVIKYFNRLSDYLFVLARFLCQKSEDCKEVIWSTK
ncbi:MAG: cob(I)yrinic acid a,c-diamide adenosyltransferase [Bacteroidales bacterium]|nr:cob(I)yrinic acid a,c-diamide adenosyltransferase [Bacteroidales bacterium]